MGAYEVTNVADESSNSIAPLERGVNPSTVQFISIGANDENRADTDGDGLFDYLEQ